MAGRQFTRLRAFILSICLFLAGCSATQEDSLQEASTGLFAMETYMELTAYGGSAETALEQSADYITELEAMWSVTDESSEIYRVNHSNGQPVSVSPETEKLLRFSLEIAERTNGALDPTIYPLINAWGFIDQEYRIPADEEIENLLTLTGYEQITLAEGSVTLPQGMQIDLGAVGKGYTGELLADYLKNQGITSALLDIGGNIQLIGGRPDGSSWKLGIQNPFGDGSIGVLEAEDCAVVTSGGYERYFTDDSGNKYCHILDPATGKPADSGLVSVTIIADSGLLCDALSTAIFVMGSEKGIEYWRTYGGFDMLLITSENEIILTEGIAGRFALNNGQSYAVQVLEA